MSPDVDCGRTLPSALAGSDLERPRCYVALVRLWGDVL